MTKKITPELLRECAEKHRKNGTYSMADIGRDLNVENMHITHITHVLDVIADSIEEHYVELPTDKDGKQLYIGSTVYDKNGNIYHVHGLSDGKFNVFLSKLGEGKDCAELYSSQDFTKTKPDSWERIIEDAFMAGTILIIDDSEESIPKQDHSKDELIARCRKLAGETDE